MTTDDQSKQSGGTKPVGPDSDGEEPGEPTWTEDEKTLIHDTVGAVDHRLLMDERAHPMVALTRATKELANAAVRYARCMEAARLSPSEPLPICSHCGISLEGRVLKLTPDDQGHGRVLKSCIDCWELRP